MRFGLPLFTCVAVVACSGVAIAKPAGKSTNKDPNEVVCEKQQELGSRLVSRKICMTRAEWDAARQESKETLSDAQRIKGVSKND